MATATTAAASGSTGPDHTLADCGASVAGDDLRCLIRRRLLAGDNRPTLTLAGLMAKVVDDVWSSHIVRMGRDGTREPRQRLLWLCVACATNNLEMAQRLLIAQNQRDMHLKGDAEDEHDTDAKTIRAMCLSLAAHWGNLQLVELLLRSHVVHDLDIAGGLDDGPSPLHLVIASPYADEDTTHEILERLLGSCPDPTSTIARTRPPLLGFAITHHKATTRMLQTLIRVSDINVVIERLQAAIDDTQIDLALSIVQCLASTSSSGISRIVNPQSRTTRCLLLAAFETDSIELAESLLVWLRPDRDLINACLVAATARGFAAMTALVIAHGAEVNAPCTMSMSFPLHQCADRVGTAYTATSACLIRHGAVVTAQDVFGSTALEAARRRLGYLYSDESRRQLEQTIDVLEAT